MPEKPKILIAASMTPLLQQGLDREYACAKIYFENIEEDFVKRSCDSARAIVTRSSVGAGKDLILACPNLEIIATFGVGTELIPLDETSRLGIVVANTPDAVCEEVADLAVALLLASLRNIPINDRYLRDGRWTKDARPPLSQGVQGRRVGIVGLGRIGGAVAKRLAPFGCEIAYHGRSAKPDVPYPFFADLVAMARNSDVLVLATPGGASTSKIVNREVLDALGPTGVLVNVGRGSAVDETALVAALLDGRLGGAALDVFADEPHVPSELLGMPNVILQPHQGAGTVSAKRAQGEMVLQILADHFAGRPVRSAVN